MRSWQRTAGRRRGLRQTSDRLITDCWSQIASDRIELPFLGEFGTQAASLYADHRVDLGIEIILPAKYFSGDLIFLEWSAWMIEGVFGDITKKFAKGLRTVQDGAAGQLLYFSLD